MRKDKNIAQYAKLLSALKSLCGCFVEHIKKLSVSVCDTFLHLKMLSKETWSPIPFFAKI